MEYAAAMWQSAFERYVVDLNDLHGECPWLGSTVNVVGRSLASTKANAKRCPVFPRQLHKREIEHCSLSTPRQRGSLAGLLDVKS